MYKESRPHFGKLIRRSIFLFDAHIMSFINFRKSKTIFKSSLNSHVSWDTLYIGSRRFFPKRTILHSLLVSLNLKTNLAWLTIYFLIEFWITALLYFSVFSFHLRIFKNLINLLKFNLKRIVDVKKKPLSYSKMGHVQFTKIKEFNTFENYLPKFYSAGGSMDTVVHWTCHFFYWGSSLILKFIYSPFTEVKYFLSEHDKIQFYFYYLELVCEKCEEIH